MGNHINMNNQVQWWIWFQPGLFNALKAIAGLQKVPTHQLIIQILQAYVDQRKLEKK